MITLVRLALDGARGFVRDEAQDVFEYVLIIGIITVAVLVAVATPIGETLIDAVVTAVCNAIDGLATDTDGFITTPCADIVNPGP